MLIDLRILLRYITLRSFYLVKADLDVFVALCIVICEGIVPVSIRLFAHMFPISTKFGFMLFRRVPDWQVSYLFTASELFRNFLVRAGFEMLVFVFVPVSVIEC